MRQLHKILGVGRFAALAMLVLVFAQGPAQAAGAQDWTLQDSAGDVRLVKSGISPIALTTGDVFGGGDWIETGPDGRAVLMRGEERIVVAPNSRIGLPRENAGPFTTRILQTLGTILLTVEKKANQHFEVQTPYLAAVVKGTTFTVGIQGQRAVVHVVEGMVEVRDLASGQRSLVRPGQTGSVLSGSNSGVSVQGGNQGRDTPAGASTQSVPVAPGETASSSIRPGPATNAQAQSKAAIVIREALGPVKVDLSNTTGGLMREAKAATKSTYPGEASVNPGVRGNSVAARASAGQTANSAVRDGVGAANGLALGKSVRASGLSGSGPDLAAVTPPGGALGVNGLSNGIGASVAPPGQSVSPAQSAVTTAVNPGKALGGVDAPGRSNGLGKDNAKAKN